MPQYPVNLSLFAVSRRCSKCGAFTIWAEGATLPPNVAERFPAAFTGAKTGRFSANPCARCGILQPKDVVSHSNVEPGNLLLVSCHLKHNDLSIDLRRSEMNACCWCWPMKDGLPARGQDLSQVAFMIGPVSHSSVNLSNKTCTCRGSSVESCSFGIHDAFDHALAFNQKQLFAQASIVVQTSTSLSV